MEQQHSTISYNPILDTDSYKPSHYLQLPPGAQSLFGYIESRGGVYGKTLFFGLQYILSRYLSTRVTYPMIEEARELLSAHGEPFNEEGWRHIVDQHGGRLPLEICAVPEGSRIPNHNALVTVRSTDPEVAWLEAYMETMLLRVWYSIPTSEQLHDHQLGGEGEADAYRNMLRQFGGPGKIFACVVDSYDIFNAVENLFGGILKDEIIASQGIVVVRPDSGNPVEMALATAKMLKAKFGAVRNSKGFDVLNNTQIIYGDGINERSIRGILMELKGY